MLEKDPSKRATLEQLKNNEWINEGFTVKLTQEASKQGIIAHIKDSDLNVSDETVAYAMKLVKNHSEKT